MMIIIIIIIFIIKLIFADLAADKSIGNYQ